MRAKHVLTGLGGAALLFVATAVSAGETPGGRDSLITVPRPLQEYYYRGLEPERLSYVVDLWYDAVLKGDDDLVIERESILFGLLQQDLDSSGHVLQAFDRLLVRSQAEAVSLDTAESLKDDYPLLETLERDVFTQARQDYRVKERILSAIRRTTAKSNKYRLMSDYIEVLRREIGLPRLRLAMRQTVGDAGQETLVPVDVRVTEGVIGTSEN